MQPTVKISRHGAHRIRSGHLWVYRSDLLREDSLSGGCVARVLGPQEEFVGQAFYSDRSQIALRLLTRSDQPVDDTWWRRRLRWAIQRRSKLRAFTTACRLVHGEADLCPSLIVDLYGEVLVLQSLSQGTERLKEKLGSILLEETSAHCLIERNDARVRHLEGLDRKSSVLVGEDPGEVEVLQHGVRFLVSPLQGQKTGAFLDQRENYLAARAQARGRVLDCFTFQGGFALFLAPVCESVLGLDISKEALAWADRNRQLNGFNNVTFEQANVFDALKDLQNQGERFETIVLDPPAFAKNRTSIGSARRGYKEINLRALKLVEKEGVLVTCSCSYHLSEPMLLELVLEAASDAGRRVQLLEKRSQSSDHPVLLGMPETQYLKCLILRVID